MIQLTNIIPSHILKVILLYTILFLVTSVVILFTILLIHKLYKENREKRKAHLKDECHGHISKYLSKAKIKLKSPRKNLEYEALAEVCIDLLISISQKKENKLKELIKELSLIEYYQKLANSFSWIKRFYAVEKLGYFRQDELKEYFIDIINKEKIQYVKAKAAWALSLIADEDALKKITQTLSSEVFLSSKFNEYIYTNIIGSFRRKAIIDKFLFYLESLINHNEIPLLLKRDIIEACGSSYLKESEKTITHYFYNFQSSPQLKITCIRTLGKLKVPESAKVILSGFTDNDWRVRAVSATAAALCDEKVIPHLQALLYDKFYYVRINATKILTNFGEKGKLALQNEMNSEDKFVRDTVRYFLKK